MSNSILEFSKQTRDLYLISEFEWDNPLQYENGILELLMYRIK